MFFVSLFFSGVDRKELDCHTSVHIIARSERREYHGGRIMASSLSSSSNGCGLSCAHHLRNSLKASGSSVPSSSSSSSSSLHAFKMNTKSSRFLRQRMTTTTTAKTNTTRAFNASSFNASSRDRQRREQQRGETKSRTLKAVPAWHPENKNDVPFDEPTPGFSSIPSA